MKLSNEELNKIMMKADDDLERLKDRCHDLYEENEKLKDKCNMYEMNMYREENEKNKYKQIIYKARKMIFDNYGILDKYEIELLDDILKGDDK